MLVITLFIWPLSFLKSGKQTTYTSSFMKRDANLSPLFWCWLRTCWKTSETLPWCFNARWYSSLHSNLIVSHSSVFSGKQNNTLGSTKHGKPSDSWVYDHLGVCPGTNLQRFPTVSPHRCREASLKARERIPPTRATGSSTCVARVGSPQRVSPETHGYSGCFWRGIST